ncbi:MAG: cobalt-precorrin-6A reductase [Alphaproteobacteria bacterium]|nr:cobalt-precorrin-6A reductase [Alphaproteobacteria bacterium]
MRSKILILGGTMEAAALAHEIDGELGQAVELVSSLAGQTSILPDLPGQVRQGGFGGTEGLTAYLRHESICAVIDATHPFAALISDHAKQACRNAGVPLACLERAPWPREAGDRWVMAPTMAEAARLLPGLGKRVFLTIGRKELDVFKSVKDVWFLVRLIELPHHPLPPMWEIVQGRPPFSPEAEVQLMQQHGIDLLVTKASGGSATYGKIEAARNMGLPVLMIERPESGKGESLVSIDVAIDWIRRRLFFPP